MTFQWPYSNLTSNLPPIPTNHNSCCFSSQYNKEEKKTNTSEKGKKTNKIK